MLFVVAAHTGGLRSVPYKLLTPLSFISRVLHVTRPWTMAVLTAHVLEWLDILQATVSPCLLKTHTVASWGYLS